LLTGCFAAFGAAHAQSPGRILIDPMRPANMAEAAPAGKSGASGAGVQIILTSPERKLALIDGKVVPLGGDARGGTLVGLSDAGAVLHKDGSRDVLLMHPAIDKKPPSTAPRH
jgi:hypothetical protein